MKRYIFVVLSLSWLLASAEPGRKTSSQIDYCKIESDYQEKANGPYIGYESLNTKQLLTEEAPMELKLKGYTMKASLRRLLPEGGATASRYEIELKLTFKKISVLRTDLANSKGVYSLTMLNGLERTNVQCQLGVVGE